MLNEVFITQYFCMYFCNILKNKKNYCYLFLLQATKKGLLILDYMYPILKTNRLTKVNFDALFRSIAERVRTREREEESERVSEYGVCACVCVCCSLSVSIFLSFLALHFIFVWIDL